ncbi:zinc finger protein 366 [Callorhinchus milii]|uniref:Zinc finger protein 366 n=1 Tax=Callorhinchus milii TaxID=7868 RepID=A0A4W3HLY4_CALMI|nr:zinc finger protein 366 [Callorhinchus milii]|eukprot:gi/632963620/ref/XP_007897984.1/ PREDICTED: zinc finger protein 366 [Callorhinchus milii]
MESKYIIKMDEHIPSFRDFKEIQTSPQFSMQPLSLTAKPNKYTIFRDNYESGIMYSGKDVSTPTLERFPVNSEGGSRKRKSTPTKVIHTSRLDDFSIEMEEPEDIKMDIPSPKPTAGAQMIDLSNGGFQFFRTLDHLGTMGLKPESIKHNVMWPASPLMMHSPRPYFANIHPEFMFPFVMAPPSLHFRHPFYNHDLLGYPIGGFHIAEENGQKNRVERVDVNIKIDDTYYVDVGGDQKRWQCRMCEKSYTSKYNLVTHILGHSGIKPHACSQCGKLFKQLSHLHTHMLTHQGTRPHKCLVCNKAFTQTSHLKRHMMQHSDVKPYTCGICGRGFAYPSELKAHETKHENGRDNICVECGLDFPTLAQLKRHLTSHRGPILYQCNECDKTFQYPSQLQNHMMKHKDIRPYICTECGMEFIQPHHLKQHSLTHKGVKEHKCGICGREFTLLANMKRHVLIHTNIRAYQCHLCFKSFVQKQTLKAHMIVHSDIKPFKCKLCGKEFNRMHNLMGHMHLHSDNKPFKCIYCPSKFTLKGNLTRHMKIKHGVMDGGPNSHSFRRRGLSVFSQANLLSNFEQEEPFDLSQKSRVKTSFSQSDGESAKGSSCHEEDEDNYYTMGQYSPEEYCRDDKLYVPEDLSLKAARPLHNFRDLANEDKERVMSEDEEDLLVNEEFLQNGIEADKYNNVCYLFDNLNENYNVKSLKDVLTKLNHYIA